MCTISFFHHKTQISTFSGNGKWDELAIMWFIASNTLYRNFSLVFSFSTSKITNIDSHSLILYRLSFIVYVSYYSVQRINLIWNDVNATWHRNKNISCFIWNLKHYCSYDSLLSRKKLYVLQYRYVTSDSFYCSKFILILKLWWNSL